MATHFSWILVLLLRSEVPFAKRTHVDLRKAIRGTQRQDAPCMQLEAAQDELKAKCYWQWCRSGSEVPRKDIDFCKHAKPHIVTSIGFSFSMPVFNVPLAEISVQLAVDGVTEHQEPLAKSAYKALQVAAGVGIYVHVGFGQIAFGFSGSLKVVCNHCENFSTLWNTLVALLIHDYFKFVRKSAEETTEIMQTLTDGLKDAEELVDRSVAGSVLMQEFSVTVEYTGKFFATASAALQIPLVPNTAAAVEKSYETHRKTLVEIGPWGRQEEDHEGRLLPTYVMLINDRGYEMVSVSRIGLTNNYGTLGVAVQCDSENGFVLQISLSSDKPHFNATETSVAMWQTSVNRILADSRFDSGYCVQGRRWGHKRMSDGVVAAKDAFLPLLKARNATGTETVTVLIPSGSSKASLSLRRETDLDLRGVHPVITSLIRSGVTLFGTTVRLQYKQVVDVGAAYLLGLFG